MYKCIIINYNIIHIHSIIAQQRLASATWVQSSRDSSVRLNFGILKLGCFITINIKKKIPKLVFRCRRTALQRISYCTIIGSDHDY